MYPDAHDQDYAEFLTQLRQAFRTAPTPTIVRAPLTSVLPSLGAATSTTVSRAGGPPSNLLLLVT